MFKKIVIKILFVCAEPGEENAHNLQNLWNVLKHISFNKNEVMCAPYKITPSPITNRLINVVYTVYPWFPGEVFHQINKCLEINFTHGHKTQ